MDPEFHVSSATFSHSFRNFSKINKLISSPACWIQNLPWKIFIEPAIQEGTKYMSVYVGCTESLSNPWSCRAVVEMYKLHGSKPKMIKANTTLIFANSSTSWGHVQFMRWDAVLNPNNGFISDDSIIIEVTIDAEIPVGLLIAPDRYTDERAIVASKEWALENQVLQKEILELDDLKKKSKAKIISLLQDIENLKKQFAKHDELVQQLEDCQKNLENEQKKLKELQDVNKDCETNLSTQKEIVDKLKKSLTENESMIISYATKLQTADANLKELNDSKVKNLSLEEKLSNVSKQLQECLSTRDESDVDKISDTKLQTTETENLDLKKKLSSIENELTSSNTKLQKEIENYTSQIKEIESEKRNLKNNLGSITKQFEAAKEQLKALQLSSSKELDVLKANKETLLKNVQNLKNETNEFSENNKTLKTENDKLTNKISTLNSKLDEITKTLSSTNLKSDQYESELNKVKTENQNLIAQMKVGYEKYNELINEKNAIESQLALLNTSSSKAKEETDLLKVDLTGKLKELADCTNALQLLKTETNDLKSRISQTAASVDDSKDTKSLPSKLDETIITAASNDAKDVQSLPLKLNETTTSVASNDTKDSQSLPSRLNETTITIASNDAKDAQSLPSKLNETTTKVASNEANDVQSLPLKPNKTTTKSQNEELKGKQDINILTENNNLKAKLLFANAELAAVKEKVTLLEEDSKEMKEVRDQAEKLKTEIDSLKSLLTESKEEIQRMKSKLQKRTAGNESQNVEIDLNNENTIDQTLDGINATPIVESEKLTEMEEKYKIVMDARTKLECEVEILRNKFGKIYKEAYETFQTQNKDITTKLNDLQFRLDEEKKEKQRILERKKDSDDKLNELNQENEAQMKVKNNLIGQVRQCHQLSKEVFWIVIELVKIKKSQEEMPCSLEIRLKSIMEILNKNKRRAFLESADTSTDYNQPPGILISTDVIQKKLQDLEVRLEKEIMFVTQELKSEQNRGKKLKLSIAKISALLENEIFISDQYKKLAKINDTRSNDVLNRLHDANTQLFTEKSRRSHYQDESQRFSKTIETMEVQMDRLRKKLWKQALDVINESSTNCLEDIFHNSKPNEATAAAPAAVDVTENTAGCDSETATNENPLLGHDASTELSPDSNKTIDKQTKNVDVDESTQSTKISDSNPSSLNNAN